MWWCQIELQTTCTNNNIISTKTGWHCGNNTNSTPLSRNVTFVVAFVNVLLFSFQPSVVYPSYHEGSCIPSHKHYNTSVCTGYRDPPDEFSVAPVVMESCWVFSCRQPELILPTWRPDAPVLLRRLYVETQTHWGFYGALTSSKSHEDDWSIWSKRWQDKFLCYQVVYKRTLSNFPWTG